MSEIKSKFSVGDWVTTVRPYHLKSPPITKKWNHDGEEKYMVEHRIPMQVIEVHTQTCPGGTQIHYLCRAHFLELRENHLIRRDPYWQTVWTKQLDKFNELEVEAYTEEMERHNAELTDPPKAEKESE